MKLHMIEATTFLEARGGLRPGLRSASRGEEILAEGICDFYLQYLPHQGPQASRFPCQQCAGHPSGHCPYSSPASAALLHLCTHRHTHGHAADGILCLNQPGCCLTWSAFELESSMSPANQNAPEIPSQRVENQEIALHQPCSLQAAE